jgi:hypothetical protein
MSASTTPALDQPLTGQIVHCSFGSDPGHPEKLRQLFLWRQA